MPDKKLSEMATTTPVTGAERILIQGADGGVILASGISAYVIDDLIASDAATPTTGDYVIGFRGTDEKKMTLNAVSTYAVDYAWSIVTTNASPVGSDMLLTNRTDVVYETSLDSLKTYILTDVQATALNTSTLGAATLSVSGTTDLLPICQTGAPTVPKTLTLAALETRLWTDFGTYTAALTAIADGAAADSNTFYVLEGSTPKKVAASTISTYILAEMIAAPTLHAATLATLDEHLTALDAVGTIADTDLFYTTKSGVAKKVTALEIGNYAAATALELPWKEIPIAKYTHSDPPVTTPASTSTITMTDTTDFVIGSPVKYTYGGNTYYGIVTAISPNTLLTIAGAPLIVASPITALYVGTPDLVTQLDFVTEWAAAGQNIFADFTGERHRWGKSAAYLVQFSATQGVVDTGVAQPKLNVKVNSEVVSTTSNGLQLSAVAGTWADSAAIAIDTTKYKIERGEPIDILCTVAGTNGDARILSVTCIFVSE